MNMWKIGNKFIQWHFLNTNHEPGSVLRVRLGQWYWPFWDCDIYQLWSSFYHNCNSSLPPIFMCAKGLISEIWGLAWSLEGHPFCLPLSQAGVPPGPDCPGLLPLLQKYSEIFTLGQAVCTSLFIILCREYIFSRSSLLFGKIAMSADVCNLGWSMLEWEECILCQAQEASGQGPRRLFRSQQTQEPGRPPWGKHGDLGSGRHSVGGQWGGQAPEVGRSQIMKGILSLIMVSSLLPPT